MASVYFRGPQVGALSLGEAFGGALQSTGQQLLPYLRDKRREQQAQEKFDIEQERLSEQFSAREGRLMDQLKASGRRADRSYNLDRERLNLAYLKQQEPSGVFDRPSALDQSLIDYRGAQTKKLLGGAGGTTKETGLESKYHTYLGQLKARNRKATDKYQTATAKYEAGLAEFGAIPGESPPVRGKPRRSMSFNEWLSQRQHLTDPDFLGVQGPPINRDSLLSELGAPNLTQEEIEELRRYQALEATGGR